MARKTTYTEKAARLICERIAEGEPLRQICRDETMPAWRTVYRWMVDSEDFAARIACARVAGFDAIAEECLEIADWSNLDTRIDKDGVAKADAEWIARSKLRVETRLKLLAKWDPKRYGEKQEIEHTGKGGGPIRMSFTAVDADL